jgi:ParB-like chromosome segregation protein Spo0J
VGLQTIDAMLVEPPSLLDRISLQFAENEKREDFSDIERAWTLQQLREAMGGKSIEVADIATRLNIKRSRAYQLLRMLVFPPDQQRTIALLRIQERQLLPLIDAYHQEQISQSNLVPYFNASAKLPSNER